MRLTLTSPALLAADTETRTLRGVAIPYGVYGNTSAGRLCVDAGAVNIPANLRAVKLFTEHGRTTPTGFTVEATDSPDALETAFAVARTPDGDRALLEASEGVRDGLSVELDNITIEAGHVTSADLVAVAQVALPAFAGAQLLATLTDEQQAEVNDLAQQIVDATTPETPADTPADQPPEDQPTTAQGAHIMRDTATAARPVGMSPTPAPAQVAAGRRRGMDFTAACAVLSAAVRDGRSLTAALSDIVPASDVGMAALRPQWLDEVWIPIAARRYFIEAINRANLTSGLKVYGWQWNVFPQVAAYAGAKGAVPSNAATTKAIETTVQRLAGGWDLDRIFVDLGEPGFIESFFQAAIRDLGLKQDAAVGTAIGAAATADGTGVADVWAAINTAAIALAGRGATMTFCALASDLWAKYVTQSTATVPWWVPNGSNPSLNGQTGQVADVSIFMAPGLAAKTVVAGDRNAATFYEPAASPVRVNAVNLPNGGVDLGVFGYHAILVNDARGLSKVTTV